MTSPDTLLGALPGPPDFTYDWGALTATPIGGLLHRLSRTQQNPALHGEGDVAVHTRMVCDALTAMPGFRSLPDMPRRALALAALLHDLGKLSTTRLEEGQWVSPGHSAAGAHMARELLWRDFGLCGTPERQGLRETVCGLIRCHMLPVHILDREEPERRLTRLAADAQLCGGFSVALMCMLAEADIRGRLCADSAVLLETVALCRETAAEAGCLHGPRVFADSYTQRAYFQGRSVWQDQALYDDTWGWVTLLSALPGTGKDTWTAAHAADMPVISLDQLRGVMGVSPTEAQGRVVQAAQEQARIHLRAHQPFLWNATNLTQATRQKLVTLCEGYGASVRIVYLETDWEENLRRNAERKAGVPEPVITSMLGKLSPPQRWEARQVDWQCV